MEYLDKNITQLPGSCGVTARISPSEASVKVNKQNNNSVAQQPIEGQDLSFDCLPLVKFRQTEMNDPSTKDGENHDYYRRSSLSTQNYCLNSIPSRIRPFVELRLILHTRQEHPPPLETRTSFASFSTVQIWAQEG